MDGEGERKLERERERIKRGEKKKKGKKVERVVVAIVAVVGVVGDERNASFSFAQPEKSFLVPFSGTSLTVPPSPRGGNLPRSFIVEVGERQRRAKTAS
jgi:hypothetical protein